MNDRNKKVPAGEHLPLAARIHRDAVRNFAPVKILGLAAMALIGILGLLLATQAASPQTSAATNGNPNQACAPASAPDTQNQGVEYTLCTPTTLTFKQVEGTIEHQGIERAETVVEVVLVSENYPPATVGYVVSNDDRCPSDEISDIITEISYPNSQRVEGYKGGSEWSRPKDAFERRWYQGSKTEIWWDEWDEDNSKEFKFKYAIMGSGGANDDFGVNKMVSGKYLCLSISYWDDNIKFRTLKRFDLLQVEMTSKTRTDAGTTYEFVANRDVHWAQGSADGFGCDLEVATSGQTSSNFTLEANGPAHRFGRCVQAEDANGVQAWIVFFVSKEDAVPSERQAEDGNQPEQTDTDDENNGQQEDPVPDKNEESGGSGDAGTDSANEQSPESGEEESSEEEGGDDSVAGGQNNGGGGGAGAPPEADNDPQAANTPENSLVLSADTTQVSASETGSGSSSAEADDSSGLPKTGILTAGSSWSELAGYIIIAGAVLGAVRIILIKKYGRTGRRSR